MTRATSAPARARHAIAGKAGSAQHHAKQPSTERNDTTVVIKNPNGGSFFTVGVLVQANQGVYWDLVIRGVPVGQDPHFAAPPCSPDTPPGASPKKGSKRSTKRTKKSSIIVVIATDAPLLPTSLNDWPGAPRTGSPGPAPSPTTTRVSSSSRSRPQTSMLRRRSDCKGRFDPERQHGPLVRSHRAGHRRGDPQRADRRENRHRTRSSYGIRDHRHAALDVSDRSVSRADLAEIQPVCPAVRSTLSRVAGLGRRSERRCAVD